MCFEKLAKTGRILQEIILNLMSNKVSVLPTTPPFLSVFNNGVYLKKIKIKSYKSQIKHYWWTA